MRRRAALGAASHYLDAIADELIAAGDFANITLAAKLADIPRSTLYRRIQLRRGDSLMGPSLQTNGV
jgi:transcriptional regulator of acetoin/glycerol metabolism